MTFTPFIQRPNEYERVVSFLLDQRFFLPVAITTSLPGGRGFGKTTLARAVCQDPRVKAFFSDGIIWITLGQGLSTLDLLSRIQQVLFDLTGKRSALEDIDTAQERLHEILHPRRTLMVIDEADDPEALKPFIQAGPGGACLLITHNDKSLPEGARRISVDIMMPDESAALLVAGIVKSGPVNGETKSSGLPLEPGGTVYPEGAGLITGDSSPGWNEAAPPLDLNNLLAALCDRLNEWPLLLGLANGLLRENLLAGRVPEMEWTPEICAALSAEIQAFNSSLDRCGITAGWRIDDPEARKRALEGVMASCQAPLSTADREHYFELSVFPVQENIPLSAAAVMWGVDRDGALALAGRLNQRGLITLEPEMDTFRLQSALHACLQDQYLADDLAGLHNHLVESYRKRCSAFGGWSTGPDDGYYFQHLAGHLVSAGRRGELQSLLFDYGWLARYLSCTTCPGGRYSDLYALLADFDIALSAALDQQSAQLRLVQQALALSAPALAEDPGQLAPQMLGRLLPFQEPEIQGLIEKVKMRREDNWLRPLAACFTPPGSEVVRTLVGHTDWVTAVSILPDGQHAVSGSLDGTLREWDMANGQMVRMIEAHPNKALVSNGEPKPLAPGRYGTGSLNASRANLPDVGAVPVMGSFGVWGNSQQPPVEIQAGGVGALVITPDGRKAVTAGWDGMVRIWNLVTGSVEREFQAHQELIGAMVIIPNGQQIVTGADDRLIRVWDLATGRLLFEMMGHTDLVRTLAITPDGRTLVSGSWDNSLRLWDMENGMLLHILNGHTGWVRSVTITPDGFHALSGAWDRTLRIWDLWTGETERLIEGFSAQVQAITVTQDNRRILTGSGDGNVDLWDFTTGERLRTLSGHTGGVNQISLTNGERFVVSASDDGTLRIWDLVAVEGGQLRPGHDGPVHSLAGMPDGRSVLSASGDGKIKVWEQASGQEIRTLAGHEGGVTAIAVTADGHAALTGSQDCTVRLWDVTRGQEVSCLKGHEKPVTSVAMTPDRKYAASGDDGGALRVWDLTTGRCLAEFRGDGAIMACAITPDGRTITASEASGKIYFLEVEK